MERRSTSRSPLGSDHFSCRPFWHVNMAVSPSAAFYLMPISRTSIPYWNVRVSFHVKAATISNVTNFNKYPNSRVFLPGGSYSWIRVFVLWLAVPRCLFSPCTIFLNFDTFPPRSRARALATFRNVATARSSCSNASVIDNLGFASKQICYNFSCRRLLFILTAPFVAPTHSDFW